MAITNIYKNQAAVRTRLCTTEDTFSKGIKTTNAPLDSDYAKYLINFDLKNEGTVLKPRPGYKLAQTLNPGFTPGNVLLAGSTEVEGIATTDGYTVHNFFVVGKKPDADLVDYISAKDAIMYLETDTGFISASCDITNNPSGAEFFLTSRNNTKNVHNIASAVNRATTVVSSKLLSNNFVLVKYTENSVDKYALGRIFVKYLTATTFNWYVQIVTAKTIQPSQAVNYGYNMLLDTPYDFSNVSMTASKIQLMGLLPYNADSGELLLSAKLGTSVKFKLFYKYPAADLANTKERYYTSWEMYDLDNTSSVTTLLQDITASPVVIPGGEISYTFTPSLKSFGLVVTVYKVSNINTNNVDVTTTAILKGLIDAKNGAYIAPEQSITLASYYLTNEDNNSKATAMDLVKYDLKQAKSMCTWQQRLVLWGVPKAQSILFVSDVNNPEYFPYPNNCEIFDDEIVNCVPYLDKLLVFTKTALYMLTATASLSSYNTSKVQDRLVINADDQSTMLAVLNMVYFKSGNYYYMIVPKTQSITGELQLAPISRPIEQFLDNFYENVTSIIETVYNIKKAYLEDQGAFVDNWTYLSNNQIRNVYKFSVPDESGIKRYFNLSLIYDVTIRAWTIQIHDAGNYNERQYKNTATGDVVQIMAGDNNTVVLVNEDPTKAEDTHKADVLFKNYQYIDTGFRKHSEQLKKRFREVQFFINSLSETPIRFHTAFHVDAEERKEFYKTVVDYVTDKTDPDYGLITVDRVLNDPEQTPSLTFFNGSANVDPWILDTSAFPELSVYKVRFMVSGKGYGGRVQILCMSEDMFELLNVNWVYRVMFAR